MKSAPLLCVLAVAGGIAVWVGCGSDEATNDTTTPDGGTPRTDPTTTTPSVEPDGSTPSRARGGDGGIDPPDAGPGGDTTIVACGGTTCALATDTCCVGQLRGDQIGYGCTPTTDAGCPIPAGGGDVAALKCSGQANCTAGTVCCIRRTRTGAASQCKQACDADNEAQLCDLTATTTGCAQGDDCSNDNIRDWGQLPDSYATCGGRSN
jgi:hypothetical protein